VWTTEPQSRTIRGDLRLTDRVDPDVAHDLRRGWFPGLPPGMSLADLVRAEREAPEEPPETDAVPDPPVDWQQLDLAGCVPDPPVDWQRLDLGGSVLDPPVDWQQLDLAGCVPGPPTGGQRLDPPTGGQRLGPPTDGQRLGMSPPVSDPSALECALARRLALAA
jgi:hypothetical protein